MDQPSPSYTRRLDKKIPIRPPQNVRMSTCVAHPIALGGALINRLKELLVMTMSFIRKQLGVVIHDIMYVSQQIVDILEGKFTIRGVQGSQVQTILLLVLPGPRHE